MFIDEEIPKAEDFVVALDDLSGAKLEDISVEKTVGEHEVDIVAKDKYGNKTKKTAKLTIKEDKEPPVFSGLFPI